MSANRFIEQEIIRKSIFLPIGIPESKRIFFVNGIFGSGKSHFVRNFIDEVLQKKVVDSVLFLDGDYDVKNLCESVNALTINFNSSDDSLPKFSFPECEFNNTKFNELLEILKNKDESMFNEATQHASLFSESDFIINNKTLNYNFDENLLEKYIENKGDRRLITDLFRVSAEALIVDLMNNYFPWENLGDEFERYYSDSEPKKVLFVFDNIENIDFTIIKWLSDNLIDYCCNKKFSDFISYNISYLKDDTKISKYLDFRFVIASRENYLQEKIFDYKLDRYKSITGFLKLEPLKESDLQDFFDNLKVTVNSPYKEIIDLTWGLPVLITTFLENIDNTGPEQIQLLILESALSVIAKGLSVKERDWLICAAFLNEFDEKGLRCFDSVGSDYNLAYSFLKNKNSYSVSGNDKKKIIIKPIIKDLIKGYFKTVQPEYYEVCIERALVYDNIKETLNLFNKDELNVVRSFAYFKAFDLEIALEDTFKTDTHLAKEYLQKNPDIFIKNKTTFSLKSEIAQKLDQYNKAVDGFKYEQKKELIKESWNTLSESLNKKRTEFSTQLDSLQTESSLLEDSLKSSRQEYETDQSKYLENENILIDMRRDTIEFTKKSNLSSSIICLIITIILALITNYFPDAFKDLITSNKNLYNILYISSYSFTILFGILTIVYFIKEINILSRKDEYNQLTEEISKIEEENNKLQQGMRANKDSRSESETKLSEMLVRKKLLENEIEVIKLRLEEQFI